MMKVLSQFFHSISTDALTSKALINNKKMNIACTFSNAAGNKAGYHNSVAEAFNCEYFTICPLRVLIDHLESFSPLNASKLVPE